MRDLRFTVSPATHPQLVTLMTGLISEYLSDNRHPDGVAPAVLAEYVVTKLRAGLVLWTEEDLEARTDESGAA